jgi:hypothetical protein
MLQLVTVGQRQPPVLGGQEVSLEIVVDGAVGLLACLPSAFVTIDNISTLRELSHHQIKTPK